MKHRYAPWKPITSRFWIAFWVFAVAWIGVAGEIFGAAPQVESSADRLRRRYGLGGAQPLENEDLRMVEGIVYHVHVLSAWFRNGGVGPRPLPAWERLRGRIEGFDRTRRFVILALPASRPEKNLVVGTSVYVAIRNFPTRQWTGSDDVMLFVMRMANRSLNSEEYGEMPVFDAGRALSPKEAADYIAGPVTPEPRGIRTNAAPR